MDTTAKIKLLEERFQKLASSEKENYGVCRKLNIHGCIKGVCNISEQKSSDIVGHPKLSCVVGVL